MSKVKPRRCPKCGSMPGYYIEMASGHSMSFEVDAQGYASEEGILDEGYPTHVVAACKCGNRWRLRGVLQITELQRNRTLDGVIHEAPTPY